MREGEGDGEIQQREIKDDRGRGGMEGDDTGLSTLTCGGRESLWFQLAEKRAFEKVMATI